MAGKPRKAIITGETPEAGPVEHLVRVEMLVDVPGMYQQGSIQEFPIEWARAWSRAKTCKIVEAQHG
jgi:hypothetical protein